LTLKLHTGMSKL